MAKDFFTAIKERRSYYDISPASNIPDERIEELVQEALLHAPSAFNSQSARVVLLLNQHHKKFWSITLEALRKIVPAEKFKPTEDKIASFANGYGTVLFFDDTSVVKALQAKFPTYSDNFPIWAQQANGILQYVVWTSLEIEGLGASLQHYNPLVDDAVKKEWNVEDSWQLIAQMPFGVPVESPGEKSFLPLEDRLVVFGKN
jgi:predicted oxidoreductase (fatty acid repression mutant protein)